MLRIFNHATRMVKYGERKVVKGKNSLARGNQSNPD